MAEIYRAIITSKFKTQNLLHFHNMVGDTVSPVVGKNNVYLSFGRQQQWADNETDVGFAPPYPIDTSDGVVDVWTNMIGVVKIKKEFFEAVIPRRDYGDVRYDRPRSFHIGDIIVVNSAPYNRTEPGKGMIVYRCVDIPDDGSCSISTIDNKIECLKLGGVWEPTITSTFPPIGTGDAIDMKDGYFWEYLYTIPADVSINSVTNEFIIVPFPEEIQEDPKRWGMEEILQSDPDRYDVIYRVKCNTLRFKAYLDSLYFPESALPGNKGFRQMSIILNPLEAKPLQSSPDVQAAKDNYKLKELEKHTGEMIYIENRQPIIRASDQVEEVSIFFDF
ncbi:MAG: baseplate wedge subunit [Bacilli bacterium]